MKLTKTDLYYIIPFLLFVAIGILGAFNFPFREDKKALALTFKWCLVPSLLMGSWYSFYGAYTRAPEQAKWRKYLGVFALTLLTTMILLRSFQGYILVINGYIGEQNSILVSGVITKVDKPRQKKLLSSYSIHLTDATNEQIVLEVPGTNWEVGQKFTKPLRIGSLGIKYGE